MKRCFLAAAALLSLNLSGNAQVPDDGPVQVAIKIEGVESLKGIDYAVFHADSTSVGSIGSMKAGNLIKIKPFSRGESYIIVFAQTEELYGQGEPVKVEGEITSVTGYHYEPKQLDEIANKLGVVRFTVPTDAPETFDLPPLKIGG